MLIGDSHARMLIPTFTRIARDNNLTLSVGISGGCPWQLGVYTPNSPARCKRYKDDLYSRVIPALQPDVVVAVELRLRRPVDPAGPGGRRCGTGRGARRRRVQPPDGAPRRRSRPRRSRRTDATS